MWHREQNHLLIDDDTIPEEHLKRRAFHSVKLIEFGHAPRIKLRLFQSDLFPCHDCTSILVNSVLAIHPHTFIIFALRVSSCVAIDVSVDIVAIIILQFFHSPK